MQKTILCTVTMFLLSLSLLAQERTLPDARLPDAAPPDSLVEQEPVYRKKPRIAILPFTNANAQAKEAELGRTVSSMLATALRNQTNFSVLEHNELHRVLNEHVLASSGLTKEQTQELGKLYDVEVILVGDVSLINKTLHIDARLIATRSSEIVVALYGTCHDLKQIRDVVEGLANELEQRYLRQWMGSITITSQPAGAEVYLDHKFIGFTDAFELLQIPNLLEGTYHLRLIRGGYFDWEGKIDVLAKMERTVKVSLTAKPGSMNINSEPTGAQVFLDNNRVGQTPMSLKQVAEGEHEIRLVKENYKPWTQKVVVRSFQPTDVKATLEVSPGMLTVNSTPSSAEIYLKGKRVAKSPHTFSNIPPGELVVRVKKPGYEAWTSSVLIQPSKQEILDVALAEKMGTLSILSQPEGAIVFLAREGQTAREIGRTPILNFEAPIGRYTIAIEKDDYFRERKQIVVQHKRLLDLSFDLQEKPGAILVETTPPNARIFLDGSYKGRAPFLLENIEKGEYNVTVRLPYAEESRRVSVAPNRHSVVRAKFKKSKRYILGVTSIGIAGLLFHLLAK
ncbi:MAG: FlgO family outer membrane protein [bacterium]